MATLIRSSAVFASRLRLELCERARQFAQERGLYFELSYGSSPTTVFAPQGGAHGNFFTDSFHAIQFNPSWRKRLNKIHTSDSLPRADRRWCELDSCNSSDALLMNIFCHPDIWSTGQLSSLLGVYAVEPQAAPFNPLLVEWGCSTDFGFKARVPLKEGKFDRTEVDMRIGNLLVEAKLTEADFRSKAREYVNAYRDIEEVFSRRDLPQSKTSYGSYQLIRNVLAAYALNSSFCVMLDARRPDLLEQWYAVMRCVRHADLRSRCKVLTWQELSGVLPIDLQSFLDEKYGIRPGPVEPYVFEHEREPHLIER